MSFYSIFEEDDCKDVTVGDCEINHDDVILSDFVDDAYLCQSCCNIVTGCEIFRFNGTDHKCTLLKDDYHDDCRSSGGPRVG